MVSGANTPEQRIQPLVWRKPALLWGLVALAIGLGTPWLVLSNEGGFALLAVLTAAVGIGAAFLSLGIASAMGRPPRSRREVLLHVIWLTALAALCAPLFFQALLHAMEGVEAPMGPVGLSDGLPFALWPLALFLGLPLGLFAGLVLGFVAMTRAEAPLTLHQAAEPQTAQRDDTLF